MRKNESNTPVNPESIQEEELLDIDWFLQALVNLVNGTENVFPITLNVGGVLISGKIVSGHKYFEGFAKDATEGLHGAEANKIEEYFRKPGEIYIKTSTEVENKQSVTYPQFIHLRNAKIFLGRTAIPTNRGVWWRGKLASVDGFILGTLSYDRKNGERLAPLL